MVQEQLKHLAAASVFVFLVVLPIGGLAQQPQELSIKGTYVHSETGREFPERLGEFRREKIKEYGPYDIGIGYNLESPIRPLAATVYLYPHVDIPFTAELAAIEERHEKFKLEFERDVQLEKGQRRLECRLAGMSYDDWFARRHGPVTSYLLICDDSPWRVKWRLTHPATTETDIDAVMKSLAAPLTVRD